MPTYHLDLSPAAPPRVPVLDGAQRRVVEHAGGPLLVLAGPGTGKTTTMVEAIVDVIDRRGVDPSEVLALTFGRKASEQLRDKVTARLGRTLGTSLASTFHSFAYGVVREFAPAEGTAPLRLLSAPEQDVVLRELLSDAPESVRWPGGLRAAVGTRGFANEVNALLARARERGVDAESLCQIGRREGRPEWVAAGLFLSQYLDNLGFQGAVDYAGLVAQAAALAHTHRDELRRRYRWVFVDEYQDTDPSQVALLQAVAGDGRNLVVVGDPDQSIYGFRGADVRCILDFPREFPTADGHAAPVVALAAMRRFGSGIHAASRGVARSLPAAGSISAERWAELRDAVPVVDDPGRVEVATFDGDRAEAEHIADLLRRAHLEDGTAWSDMAVLVRSGRDTIPALRRALVAAGVPVDVAVDETPLATEPATVPLLDALQVVAHLHEEDPRSPYFLDAAKAESLLLSPLGGMDAVEIRTLAKALRRRDPVASSELVRRMVVDPTYLAGVGGGAARRARGLAELLAKARARLDEQASAEEVLWELWDGTEWPQRLRRTAMAGGPAALMAHRDLDVVCGLFEAAARAEEKQAHTGVAEFIETLRAQQIPADTLADKGVRGDAVRLLTAHRSKGLEWDLVVVAHVQEESWPDLRRRATLLHADELGPDGCVPPLTQRELLAEERRLFYVAVTRARRRLVVTAVASPDEDGEQPSRFLADLGVPVQRVLGRPRRPLSLDGLVAELRRAVADDVVAAPLREAAARRLARLMRESVGGVPVAPRADPASWWGTRGRSHSANPVRDPEQPVRLTATGLESLLTCPARWFLEKEAGGNGTASSAQGFGNVVHALADRLAHGDLTLDGAMVQVDRVWERLQFRTPWSASRERAEVEEAMRRFLAWHAAPGARTVVATEQDVEIDVTLPGGEVARLVGRVDRLELDEDGEVWVVDLKTGRHPPADKDLPELPQLGFYQHAVDHGAVDDVLAGRGAGPGRSGGAELVQLRQDAKGLPKVQRQLPQAPGDDGRTAVEAQLVRAVEVVRAERFDAVAGAHCERCRFVRMCPSAGGGSVLT